MIRSKGYFILNNSRFYILASSFFISIIILGVLRTAIANDQLYIIRLEQVYGLLAILLWYLALIIGPLGHIIGKHRTKHLEFARRAIGVSTFYFAMLHFVIAFWGQLGGLGQVQYLPSVFVWTLLAGLGGLAVLFLLASTSFDAVVKFMTYRKWKWLHRLVYVGSILVLIHVWVLGTHLSYAPVQYLFYGMIVLFLAVELYPTSQLLNRKYLKLSKYESIILFLAAWLGISVALLIVPNLAPNINSSHDHTGAENGILRGHQH